MRTRRLRTTTPAFLAWTVAYLELLHARRPVWLAAAIVATVVLTAVAARAELRSRRP